MEILFKDCFIFKQGHQGGSHGNVISDLRPEGKEGVSNAAIKR